MKVLHVLDHSAPLHSGYAFRTLAILREQRRLGWHTAQLTSTKHEASMVTDLPEPRRTNPARETVGDFEFHRTPRRRHAVDRLPVLGQWAVVTSLRRRLADVIEEFKPDVLHAHSPSLNGLATEAAARRHGLPFVYELRALWEDAGFNDDSAHPGGLRYRISRWLETAVLRRADAVVTICEGLRGEIIGRGLPPERVTVVPNAVDLEAFTSDDAPAPELRERLGLRGAAVLGFIGSFYGYEGLALLIQALPAILRHRPDVRLLLVGGGPEESILQRQVQEAGLGTTVVFTGRVPHDQVQRYYGAVDVLVYPRLPLRVTDLVTPLKPLEAMALRRLLVASDVGGHRELIRDGETGLLFRAGNREALAARVVEALRLGAAADAIRIAARSFVERERTWKFAVSRYADVYAKAKAAARAKLRS